MKSVVFDLSPRSLSIPFLLPLQTSPPETLRKHAKHQQAMGHLNQSQGFWLHIHMCATHPGVREGKELLFHQQMVGFVGGSISGGEWVSKQMILKKKKQTNYPALRAKTTRSGLIALPRVNEAVTSRSSRLPKNGKTSGKIPRIMPFLLRSPKRCVLPVLFCLVDSHWSNLALIGASLVNQSHLGSFRFRIPDWATSTRGAFLEHCGKWLGWHRNLKLRG